MGLTREEAYRILELPKGAIEDDVRAAYKRLALRWHPDKHNNSEVATKKFQEVSAAYKRLTSGDETVDIDFMTMDDMFELFTRIFFAARFESYNGGHGMFGSGSSSEDGSADEEDILEVFADRLKMRMVQRRAKQSSSDSGFRRKLTEEEATKNADKLIQEEEKLNRLREKRRAKKKRQRERKRLEKLKGKGSDKQADDKDSNSDSDSRSEDDDDDEEEEEKITTKKLAASNLKSSKAGSSRGGSKQDSSKRHSGISSISDHKKSKDWSRIDSDEGELDPNSAFVAKAAANASKKVTAQQASSKDKQNKKDKPTNKEQLKNQEEKESVEDLDPVVLRSRQIAVRGNEMANLGHYTAAIDLFTQAIKLDPRDFRFFGNRSFCYDRLGQYDKALKDADKAISLAKEWPKGYFRKGRALAGLKLYAEAEGAFEQVLKLDRHCEDAMQELLRCRTHQLMEMGFSRPQSEIAIRQHGTVQAALESLLAGAVQEGTLSDEIYISDDEDHITKTIQASKTDVKNPEGLTSLWVGNVLPKVTEKDVRDIFSKCGQVQSVRMLPEKFCVFVNYKRKDAASKAMQVLQGYDLEGQRLLIKFPDNPIVNGQPRTTVLKKNQTNFKNTTTPTTLPTVTTLTNSSLQKTKEMEAKEKLSGPVNGDECYFWRTTGCAFGDKCHYKHLPESRGIDRKPWHKALFEEEKE
ncbi:uncharacterized protein LOC144446493 [Glandiceps talaboti]